MNEWQETQLSKPLDNKRLSREQLLETIRSEEFMIIPRFSKHTQALFYLIILVR